MPKLMVVIRILYDMMASNPPRTFTFRKSWYNTRSKMVVPFVFWFFLKGTSIFGLLLLLCCCVVGISFFFANCLPTNFWYQIFQLFFFWSRLLFLFFLNFVFELLFKSSINIEKKPNKRSSLLRNGLGGGITYSKVLSLKNKEGE